MVRFDIFDGEQWQQLATRSRYDAKALSSQLQMSLRHLHRITMQVFGCSPQQWLNQQRIESAASLLIRTRSAKQVAYELGFKQQSHFSRVFKRQYGLSPSKFLLQSDQHHRKESLTQPEVGRECPTEITNVQPG